MPSSRPRGWQLSSAGHPKPAHPIRPFLFQPSKGGLWINEPSVTIRHFKSAPKALNIRERRQYDTRHTYATLCLMPGMNPRSSRTSLVTASRCCFLPTRNGSAPPRTGGSWRSCRPESNWPKIGPRLTRWPKYTSGTPAGQALDFYRQHHHAISEGCSAVIKG